MRRSQWLSECSHQRCVATPGWVGRQEDICPYSYICTLPTYVDLYVRVPYPITPTYEYLYVRFYSYIVCMRVPTYIPRYVYRRV